MGNVRRRPPWRKEPGAVSRRKEWGLAKVGEAGEGLCESQSWELRACVEIPLVSRTGWERRQ